MVRVGPVRPDSWCIERLLTSGVRPTTRCSQTSSCRVRPRRARRLLLDHLGPRIQRSEPHEQRLEIGGDRAPDRIGCVVRDRHSQGHRAEKQLGEPADGCAGIGAMLGDDLGGGGGGGSVRYRFAIDTPNRSALASGSAARGAKAYLRVRRWSASSTMRSTARCISGDRPASAVAMRLNSRGRGRSTSKNSSLSVTSSAAASAASVPSVPVLIPRSIDDTKC